MVEHRRWAIQVVNDSDGQWANTGTSPQDWRLPVEVDLDGLSAQRQVDAAADDFAPSPPVQQTAVAASGDPMVGD